MAAIEQVVGAGSATAMTMTYEAAAASFALVLQNAAATQQVGQTIATASTATTCVFITKTAS